MDFCYILKVTHGLWPNQSFQSIQSVSHVQLFATPWTAAHQASLSITNSQSLLKIMSIKPVMPSNHLILCCPLLPLPSIFPSIRVFSSKSALHIKWPKYWSFSFSISPSTEYSGLISLRIDWLPSEGRRPVKGRPTSVTTQVPAMQPCLGACGTGSQRVLGGATGAGVSSHCLGPRRLPVQQHRMCDSQLQLPSQRELQVGRAWPTSASHRPSVGVCSRAHSRWSFLPGRLGTLGSVLHGVTSGLV